MQLQTAFLDVKKGGLHLQTTFIDRIDAGGREWMGVLLFALISRAAREGILHSASFF